MAKKDALTRSKEGLPKEAFAIVGMQDNPDTWKLLHHKKSIGKALKGKLDIEKTVDWERMGAAIVALSMNGSRRRIIETSPEQILAAAIHLAGHYRKSDNPLPDVLAALV